MFIPLQHENNQGRRWPIISIALVVLNLAVFLGTHWRLEQDSPQRAEVRNHLVILAAMHPELTMPPEAQAFVVSFQKKNPGLWNALGASGAVAALMGAFLFRFPTTKIEVAIVFGLRSLTNLAMGNGIRFKAAAYWLLPL